MDSEVESEISFDSSSTPDEDVQWPLKTSARAPDQIALDPANQKEFEKFVKKKHDQVPCLMFFHYVAYILLFRRSNEIRKPNLV